MTPITPHGPATVVGEILTLLVLIAITVTAAVQPWLIIVGAIALGGVVGIQRVAGMRRDRSAH